MSKDNIPTFQSEELSLNNAEIPTLDTQTANQLLNNVFNACDMDPSSIPVEVLAITRSLLSVWDVFWRIYLRFFWYFYH